MDDNDAFVAGIADRDGPLGDLLHKIIDAAPVVTEFPDVLQGRGPVLLNPFRPHVGDQALGQTVPLGWRPPIHGIRVDEADTRYEGRVPYAKQWNWFVRFPEATPRTKFRVGSNFFEFIPRSRSAELDSLAEIVVGKDNPLRDTSGRANDEFDYVRVLIAWWWLRNNSQPLSSETERYFQANPFGAGWPGPDWFLQMWRSEGVMHQGACNLRSLLLATILMALGMAPWRIAICSSRYEMEGVSGQPSHFYNAVYLYGRWRYYDLGSVFSGPYPARDAASARAGSWEVNLPALSLCDYRYPFGAEVPEYDVAFGMPKVLLAGVPAVGLPADKLA